MSLKCHSLVVKVASRCNLNCSYCYVYNLGDTTYLSQPKVMSKETVIQLLHRIKNHCEANEMKQMAMVFHGGEPLLAGKRFFKMFIREANKILLPSVKPFYALQTNGVLLTEEWCELFEELNICIGVSMDGTKEANDMYRVDHAGRGSYDKVIKGLKTAWKVIKHPGRKPGVLTVVNANIDPVAVYKNLRALKVPRADFLLPDATHDILPEHLSHCHDEHTAYADWLIAIFDLWFQEKEDRVQIRMFESIICQILGKEVGYDAMGIKDNHTLVIDTDGSIEPTDVLKVCGNGFTKVGATVYENEFDEALETDLAKLYQESGRRVGKICQNCTLKEVCAGGYLPHRYSKANGFDNPSVYCSNLMKLISHIQNKVVEMLPDHILKEGNLKPFSYDEIRNDLIQKVNANNEVQEDLVQFGVSS